LKKKPPLRGGDELHQPTRVIGELSAGLIVIVTFDVAVAVAEEDDFSLPPDTIN
jgi:hypothetical protein